MGLSSMNLKEVFCWIDKITEEEENSMISMSLRSFKIQSYYILGFLLLGWMVTPFSAHF